MLSLAKAEMKRLFSILVFQFKDKNGERIGDGKIGHIDLMRCSVFYFLYRKWVMQNHHCGVSDAESISATGN